MLAPFVFFIKLFEFLLNLAEIVFVGGFYVIWEAIGFGTMSEKENGTCVGTPQSNLRWNVEYDVANWVSCFNRHLAENRNYAFTGDRTYLTYLESSGTDITYYDSITGKPLFYGPKSRSMKEFLDESQPSGWPSFRQDEVNWDNVEVFWDGEIFSVDGTHLGHNLPDELGNRYCINLSSIAGNQI